MQKYDTIRSERNREIVYDTPIRSDFAERGGFSPPLFILH